MKKNIFAEGRTCEGLERGFTLVELLVAVFSFTLISMGLFALTSSIFTSYRQQGGLLSDIDQARKISNNITNQFRDAQTVSGAYPLEVAGDQNITFYSNFDNDASIERIRYFLQNGQLWEGVIQPVGSPAVYNTSTESTFKVLDNVGNGSNPVFYYYDGSYVGSSTQVSLTQPINVTQVKFVQLKLQIIKKAGVTNTNSFTVTASGAIRNLKTNLGQ
jgi:type II secretory pathway pseudopilin PulG